MKGDVVKEAWDERGCGERVKGGRVKGDGWGERGMGGQGWGKRGMG